MQSDHKSAALNIAIAAARVAGKLITTEIVHLDRIRVGMKADQEVVSQIDIDAERKIIKEIEKAYPEHNILAEESGDLGKDGSFCWVIDPLDGSMNYIHSNPHCATSIALLENGVPQVAVVFDAFRNELFTAIEGGGAQLDGRRIRVSKTSKLADSLLSTDYPGRSARYRQAWLQSLARILPRAQSVHRHGSSVLDLVHVACGRYDGIWHYGVKTWDVAAASLIIKEAGGFVTDIKGGSEVLSSTTVLAANPRIHEKIHSLLNPPQAK